MKLNAADLSLPGVALASFSDHYSRAEIMRIAEFIVNVSESDQAWLFAGLLGLSSFKDQIFKNQTLYPIYSSQPSSQYELRPDTRQGNPYISNL